MPALQDLQTAVQGYCTAAEDVETAILALAEAFGRMVEKRSLAHSYARNFTRPIADQFMSQAFGVDSNQPALFAQLMSENGLGPILRYPHVNNNVWVRTHSVGEEIRERAERAYDFVAARV